MGKAVPSVRTGEVLAYSVLDTFDGEALVMHIPSLQRNVFTNVAARTVFVLEAKQITFVSESRHTSTEARQFSENLRHIRGNLVCGARLRIFGKVARVHGVNEFLAGGR